MSPPIWIASYACPKREDINEINGIPKSKKKSLKYCSMIVNKIVTNSFAKNLKFCA